MAAKKKAKKKQIHKKRSPAVTRKPVKRPSKKKSPPKKLAKKKSASKKTAPKTKVLSKKKTAARIAGAEKNRTSSGLRDFDAEALDSQDLRTRSAGQSGGLQGLSNIAGADSESVDELIEEGNAFEAEVVAGVESADDNDGEVHTHEVPEDDVPEEYLDED